MKTGCRFWHPLTPFLTPLAPRGPRDREPLCLASAVECHEICCPLPPHLPFSFTTFTGPKYREPKNGLLRLTRWVCQTRLPVQHHYMDFFNYKYGHASHFLLPSSQLTKF